MSAKTRKMLSDWQAPYIQNLIRQIDTQSKETLVKWAVDYAGREIVPLWSERFPGDERPQSALKAAKDWQFSIMPMLLNICPDILGNGKALVRPAPKKEGGSRIAPACRLYYLFSERG